MIEKAIIIALVINFLANEKSKRRKINAEAEKQELENKILERKLKK